MESKKLIIKNKFFLLLVALLIFFIFSPLIGNKIGSFSFGILFFLVLIFSIPVITRTKLFILLLILLILLTVINILSVAYGSDHQILTLIESIIAILFFFFMTIQVLSEVIRDKSFSVNTILGAICGYLLIGLCWSSIFLLIEYLDPTAFNLNQTTLKTVAYFQTFIYYSFVSLTTLGYGDITPVEGFAKTFSWMEAATGQIYLTVWIAHLVGMYVARRTHTIPRSP